MRVLRKILVGFGVVFLAIIALFVWLGTRAHQFRVEQESFARAFVADLSQRWDVADVSTRAGPQFLQQVSTAQGADWLLHARRLGRLKSVSDLQIGNYKLTTQAETGVLQLHAKFENGEGTLSLTVTKGANGTHVVGFFINDGRLYDASRTTT